MSETNITEERFADEACAYLEGNAKRRSPSIASWGEGSDKVGLFEEKDPAQERHDVALAQAWRAGVFDAGFGWVSGPPEYGGRGLPAAHDRIWHELEAQFVTPSKTPFAVGLGMVAPTILAHGTDIVKEAYLRRMFRGEVIGCQLFSEPGAGSDLAGVATRAVPDGDDWIVSGQKVWTSAAHYSDIGEIICRTDPSAPKHRGLTAFVVDMRAPGVDVRPLRQMTGGASFNEVFLNEVRIPDHHRLGAVNGGWAVAITTLMNERASLGSGMDGVIDLRVERLAELLRHLGLDRDPVLRQDLAAIYTSDRIAQYTALRSRARLQTGAPPGPEMSMGKLALTTHLQRIGQFVSTALGPRLAADTGAWGEYAWAELVLGVPGVRVAGGTDEIQRNILAERVLGLPKDPSPAG